MWVPFRPLSICYWASQALSARLPASSFRPLGCFFAMLSVVAMHRYHVSRWLQKGKLANERLVCLASVVEQRPIGVNRSANELPWACLACSAPKKVPSACFASRRCLHSGRKCEHLCRYLYRPAWARRGAAPEIQRNSAAKDITHAAKALQTSHFTLHTALFALQT